MVFTTKIATEKNIMSSVSSISIKKPIARKLLRQFSEVLGVKKNMSVHRLGAAKSNRIIIRTGHMLLYSIPRRQVHKKINEHVKHLFIIVL